MAVLTAVRQNRFDANRPLIPWLCTIAYRRATDLTRRKSSHTDALAAVGREIAATSTGRRPKGLSSDERGEALELLQGLVAAGEPDSETGAEAHPEARALARRAGYDLRFLALRRQLGFENKKERGQ